MQTLIIGKRKGLYHQYYANSIIEEQRSQRASRGKKIHAPERLNDYRRVCLMMGSKAPAATMAELRREEGEPQPGRLTRRAAVILGTETPTAASVTMTDTQ